MLHLGLFQLVCRVIDIPVIVCLRGLQVFRRCLISLKRLLFCCCRGLIGLMGFRIGRLGFLGRCHQRIICFQLCQIILIFFTVRFFLIRPYPVCRFGRFRRFYCRIQCAVRLIQPFLPAFQSLCRIAQFRFCILQRFLSVRFIFHRRIVSIRSVFHGFVIVFRGRLDGFVLCILAQRLAVLRLFQAVFQTGRIQHNDHIACVHIISHIVINLQNFHIAGTGRYVPGIGARDRTRHADRIDQVLSCHLHGLHLARALAYSLHGASPVIGHPEPETCDYNDCNQNREHNLFLPAHAFPLDLSRLFRQFFRRYAGQIRQTICRLFPQYNPQIPMWNLFFQLFHIFPPYHCRIAFKCHVYSKC